MFDASVIALAILGFTTLLVGVIGYVTFLLGKKKTEKEVAEANIQAVKQAGQIAEAIINNSSDVDVANGFRKLREKADSGE